MRAIVQRVLSASITVNSETVSGISQGLVVLVGFGVDDNASDIENLAQKILSLKVFSKSTSGDMWEVSVKDIQGEVLCVPQFTLMANTSDLKGNKPNFNHAMSADESQTMYASFLDFMGTQYPPEKIKDGKSGGTMNVSLANEGRVTFTLDSRKFERITPPMPPQVLARILRFLPLNCIARALRVSKSWRNIIDSDPVLWCDLLESEKLWFGGDTERAFAEALIRRRQRANLPRPDDLSLANPYKVLFKSRYLTRTRWINNPEPKHLTFPAHGRSVVTCLLLSRGRIITASDDHSINIYSPVTGLLLRSLSGHEGGVWALASTKDTLVSGSTDRTVRIWDLSTGLCTHLFGGHTSTVRCLAIVKPEWVDVEDENGNIRREKWPKQPLIVTGSRDRSLRVWDLPRLGDPEYRFDGTDCAKNDADKNPYHKLCLEGHENVVRSLAARGRTLVSGSYDSTVRVWDIITGTCRWVLVGHTQKVYSVVLDSIRRQACSGSMDGTVRVWNLKTGECQYTLTGHTSLVGLLGLSPSHLVSAAADSTLRVWDPETGEVRHMLAAHTGAITCFQHDEFKVLSGSDGTLKMWDVREGTVVREFLSDIHGVWQVVFEGRWCVAASHRSNTTTLDVWDFGNGEEDDDWIGEPVGGIYDEDMTDDEDEEMEQADADAVEEELGNPPSEPNLADEPATFSDDTSADEEAFEIVDRISEDE